MMRIQVRTIAGIIYDQKMDTREQVIKEFTELGEIISDGDRVEITGTVEEKKNENRS